jgi:hypothetical protein
MGSSKADKEKSHERIVRAPKRNFQEWKIMNSSPAPHAAASAIRDFDGER